MIAMISESGLQTIAEQLDGLTDDEFDNALEKELKKYSPYWKKVIEVWVDN